MKLISKWTLALVQRRAGNPVVWAMLLVSWFSVESSFPSNIAKAQVAVFGPVGGVRVRDPIVSVHVLPIQRGNWLRVPYATISTGVYRNYRPLPLGVGFFPLPIPYYPYAVAAAPAYPVVAFPGVLYPKIPSCEYSGVTYRDAKVNRQAFDHGIISASRPRLELPLPERLRSAAETLAKTLSLREDGDVWLNYLGLQRIIENVDFVRPASELQDLIINYDGVVSNETLGSIQYARGFAASRDLLRQYLGTQAVSAAPSDQQGLVPPSIAPNNLLPEPRSPQPPNDDPSKKGLDDSADAAEQLPVSDTGPRAMQIPRVTEAFTADKLPRPTSKVVQPTSL